MTFYGLRHRVTKKPLGFCTERVPEHADFCVSVQFSLYPSGRGVWLVPERPLAQKALMGPSPDWFNQYYETPGTEFLDRPPRLRVEYEVFAVDFPEGDVTVR